MTARLSLVLALVALPTALAACLDPAAAQEPEIVVEAPALRGEIERILEGDNLNNATMDPRDVVDAMQRIPRGTAPEDFWISYREHVEAWRQFAALAGDPRAIGADMLAARQTVNSTFDEVERIARRYGARLPDPR